MYNKDNKQTRSNRYIKHIFKSEFDKNLFSRMEKKEFQQI